MPQVRILSLGPFFIEKPPKKGGFSALKVCFLSFARPHISRGQRVKVAIAASVQKNAEISKIPNPSLTGVFSTFLCASVTIS